MKRQRLVVALTLVNALLLGFLITGGVRSVSARQPVVSVLRARALEIVDEEGRVRASISVHGPETVDGIRYPEAVLLRMGDPRGAPGVKLTASANGTALGLSDGRAGGVQLYARDTASFVRVVDRTGHEQIIKP